VLTATAVMTEAAHNLYITKQGLSKNIFLEVLGNHRLSDYTAAAPLILSMYCDSKTILINAANYCYHFIVKIYRLTRYLFQSNASF